MDQRLPLGENELPSDHLLAELEILRQRESLLAGQRGGSSLTRGIGTWTSLGPGNVGGRTRAIVIDPTQPDIMYATGVTGGVWKSIDGGANWQLTDDLLPNLAVSCLALDPANPDVLYAGTGEGFFANLAMHRGVGIFRSLDAGATWSLLPGTSQAATGGAFNSARDIDVFVGGAQDNGTSRVLSVTTPDAWKLIFGGDGGYVAIDPTDSQRMFIEIQFFPEIRVSHDGGETFDLAVDLITDTDGLFITPFAMDQSNPDILWTGGNRPWRTTIGAVSWELGGPDLPGVSRISAIAIAPSNSNVVYLGFENGYVARSINALDPVPDWHVYTNGPIGGACVSSVAVDPDDHRIAYCTYSTYGVPHVLRKGLRTGAWVPIEGSGSSDIPDIPVHWIAVRPSSSQQLYVGTELGVFASDDTGGSWQPVNVGLAHTIVETLDFQDDDNPTGFSATN